jgi:CheY-like chemotaxis protein
MEILYVEDEEVKALEVKKLLSENNNVELRKSLNSGISAINEKKYDLIVLDMSLPLYDYETEDDDENDFEPFAGIDVLDELVRKGRSEKVVVITAFDILGEGENMITLQQLDLRLKNEYKEIYLGLIFYNSSSLEWRRGLTSIIGGLR